MIHVFAAPRSSFSMSAVFSSSIPEFSLPRKSDSMIGFSSSRSFLNCSCPLVLQQINRHHSISWCYVQTYTSTENYSPTYRQHIPVYRHTDTSVCTYNHHSPSPSVYMYRHHSPSPRSDHNDQNYDHNDHQDYDDQYDYDHHQWDHDASSVSSLAVFTRCHRHYLVCRRCNHLSYRKK